MPAVETVSGDVVFIEVLIYWIAFAAAITLIDLYAKKRLGKKTPAHMSLFVPRFITLAAISAFSIIAIVYTRQNDITVEALSFLGVPYLGMWFYFVVCVFRRIRAEKNAGL